jgi:hypothetical protein
MSIFERVQEDTPEHLVRLGRDAEDILDRNVLYTAIEEAEINIMEQWKYAETVAEREAAWAKVHALDGVIEELRKIRSEGEYAKKVLEQRAAEVE